MYSAYEYYMFIVEIVENIEKLKEQNKDHQNILPKTIDMHIHNT